MSCSSGSLYLIAPKSGVKTMQKERFGWGPLRAILWLASGEVEDPAREALLTLAGLPGGGDPLLFLSVALGRRWSNVLSMGIDPSIIS